MRLIPTSGDVGRADDGIATSGEVGRPGLVGLAAAILLALGLSLYGQSWGLPDTRSWSNDDIAPTAPIRAVDVWLNNWYKYPSLQPLIDRALYQPWLVAWRRSGAIVDSDECRIPTRSRCFDDPHERMGWLLRLSRLRSAFMAVGTVIAVWMMTLYAGGGRVAAVWAALFTACIQSLIFFAHAGNVDVPQVFWFAWSIVAWLAAMRGGGIRAYVAFGALAAASLATKEAIVGAYVLPGLALLWRLGRDQFDSAAETALQPSQPISQSLSLPARTFSDPRLIALVAALLGVYGLVNNVIFNFAGFREHVAYWLIGSGIEPWNDAFEGYAALAVRTWHRLEDAAGHPLLWWGAAAALWATWRRPHSRLLWLPFVSYSIFTIGLVRYVYTRFTLPMVIILCVFGGMLAEAAWRQNGLRRVAGLGLAGLVLAHSFLYTLHMDRLLVNDARYAAEEWLRENAPAETEPRIVALGSSTYLPRLDWLGYDTERLDEEEFTTEALIEVQPEYIVISGKTIGGFEGGPREKLYAIIAAAGDYKVAFDHKSTSGLERLLIAPYVETRVNPRIIVFERADG